MGPTRRLTLREAADLLGISKEAVRKRAIRGSLRTDKDPDGRVYVYLDDVEDAATDVGLSGDPRDQLIAQLQSEVEAWREESRRKDHIIAGLVERLPPQIEAPSEPRESPTADAEEPESSQPRPATGGTQEEVSDRPSEAERSWWRRLIGG